MGLGFGVGVELRLEGVRIKDRPGFRILVAVTVSVTDMAFGSIYSSYDFAYSEGQPRRHAPAGRSGGAHVAC